MVSNRAAYQERFGDEARRKYGQKPEPMCFVVLPLPEGGPMLFTDEEQEEIYKKCLNEGRPWQEYPEVVKAVRKWHRNYMRGIRRGEVY